jgi:hypothetical protein
VPAGILSNLIHDLEFGGPGEKRLIQSPHESALSAFFVIVSIRRAQRGNAVKATGIHGVDGDLTEGEFIGCLFQSGAVTHCGRKGVRGGHKHNGKCGRNPDEILSPWGSTHEVCNLKESLNRHFDSVVQVQILLLRVHRQQALEICSGREAAPGKRLNGCQGVVARTQKRGEVSIGVLAIRGGHEIGVAIRESLNQMQTVA